MNDGRRKGPPMLGPSAGQPEPPPSTSPIGSLKHPVPPSSAASEWQQPLGGHDGDDSDKPRTALLVLLSAAGAVVVILGLFMALRSPDEVTASAEQTASSNAAETSVPQSPTTSPSSQSESTSSSTSPSATTTAPPATTATQPPPTSPPSRAATLFADQAYIRAQPDLDAEILRIVEDQSGMSFTVFGSIQDGWYEVQVGTTKGWMFGAFVLPPDDGYSIGINLDSNKPVHLYDSDGARIVNDSVLNNGVNPSGNKVLIITEGDSWHRVLLPEGQRQAFVIAADIEVVQ